MEIIVKPARGGKTTEAVEFVSKNPNSVLITCDPRAAREAWIMSGLPTSEKWRFQTISTIRFLYERYVSCVVVDNLDMILSHMCNAPVRMITLTAPKSQVSTPPDGPERHADSSDDRPHTNT